MIPSGLEAWADYERDGRFTVGGKALPRDRAADEEKTSTLTQTPPFLSQSWQTPLTARDSSPAWFPGTVNCTKFSPGGCHLRTSQIAELLKRARSNIPTSELVTPVVKCSLREGYGGEGEARWGRTLEQWVCIFWACPDARLSELSMRLSDQWRRRTRRESEGGGAFNAD